MTRTSNPLTFTATGAERRSLLKDQAYEQLKQMIMQEHFPQGSFLSERVLAHELGMSKTPIRSAIERLETEGFVSVSPQQGIVVKALSLQEISDHIDLRVALECFVIKRLSGRLLAVQQEELEQCLHEEQQAMKDYDITQATESDLRFHLLLCDYLGNEQILRSIWLQHDLLFRVMNRLYRFADFKKRVEQNHLEHQQLVKLMLEGDGERAAKFMEKHIEFSKRALLMH